MNGGQVALTGFTCQVLVAVLDALKSDMWDTLAIEPSSEEGEYDKVDIRWVHASLAVRHVQVKHSKRLFSLPAVSKWARELKKDQPVCEYDLVLFGSAATTLDGVREIDGVRIRLLPLDDELSWDACSFRMSRMLEDIGQELPTENLRQVAELVAGQLLLDSRHGRVWARDELRSLIGQLAAGLRKGDSEPSPYLHLSLRRTVVIHNPDLADEYVRCVIRNQGPNPIKLNPTHFCWVQQDSCGVVLVSDGFEGVLPEENWDFGYSRDRNTFGIGVRLRRELGPGEEVIVGVQIQRSPAVQRLDERWIYSDPLLPSNKLIQSEVVLIFPFPGLLDARDATHKSSRFAVWQTVMKRSLTQVAATFEPLVPGSAGDEALLTERASQYLSAARVDLHTRLPLGRRIDG